MAEIVDATFQCPKETLTALNELAQISGFEKANGNFFNHVISKFKELMKYEVNDGVIVATDDLNNVVEEFRLIKPGNEEKAKRFFEVKGGNND